MVSELHKRAILQWFYSKRKETDPNPSIIIIKQLTGISIPSENQPKNVEELCEKINELTEIPSLSEIEKKGIQQYLIELVFNPPSKISFFAKTGFLKILNYLGYSIGVMSLIVAGFSWWIIGLSYATWLAHGATKVAFANKNKEFVKSWELPVHMILHFSALTGLIVFSFYRIF